MLLIIFILHSQQNYPFIPVFLHITNPAEKVNMSVCSPRQDVRTANVNSYQWLQNSKKLSSTIKVFLKLLIPSHLKFLKLPFSSQISFVQFEYVPHKQRLGSFKKPDVLTCLVFEDKHEKDLVGQIHIHILLVFKY